MCFILFCANQSIYILVYLSESGITILVRLVQPEKEDISIALIESGTITLFSLIQFENAP
ncbi:hypothetical protein AGMMS50212_09500 [Spirochaetia bacterium]|nr:hypothetical protein AGMMS50212_09500 [Spirochaetia bacterium]